jgi:hypothetical protein
MVLENMEETGNQGTRCPLMRLESNHKNQKGGSVSQSFRQRHLRPSQRAAVATNSLPLLEAEAKERQKLSSGRPKKGEEIIPQVNSDREPQARDKAAKLVGVNPRYVSDAKKIKEQSHETFEKGEIKKPPRFRERLRA